MRQGQVKPGSICSAEYFLILIHSSSIFSVFTYLKQPERQYPRWVVPSMGRMWAARRRAGTWSHGRMVAWHMDAICSSRPADCRRFPGRLKCTALWKSPKCGHVCDCVFTTNSGAWVCQMCASKPHGWLLEQGNIRGVLLLHFLLQIAPVAGKKDSFLPLNFKNPH